MEKQEIANQLQQEFQGEKYRIEVAVVLDSIVLKVEKETVCWFEDCKTNKFNISFFDINSKPVAIREDEGINQYKGNGKYQLITRKNTYEVDRGTWEKVLNFLTWERKL